MLFLLLAFLPQAILNTNNKRTGGNGNTQFVQPGREISADLDVLKDICYQLCYSALVNRTIFEWSVVLHVYFDNKNERNVDCRIFFY